MAKTKTETLTFDAPQAGSSGAMLLDKLGIVPAWDSVPELAQLQFGSLVEKRTSLKAEIEFREGKVKELDQEIMASLAASGVEKVEWEGRPVQVVNKKGNSRIVPEKLLEMGVSADVIAGATEVGKPSSYLLVGRPK